jgi:hypothetical protein
MAGMLNQPVEQRAQAAQAAQEDDQQPDAAHMAPNVPTWSDQKIKEFGKRRRRNDKVYLSCRIIKAGGRAYSVFNLPATVIAVDDDSGTFDLDVEFAPSLPRQRIQLPAEGDLAMGLKVVRITLAGGSASDVLDTFQLHHRLTAISALAPETWMGLIADGEQVKLRSLLEEELGIKFRKELELPETESGTPTRLFVKTLIDVLDQYINVLTLQLESAGISSQHDYRLITPVLRRLWAYRVHTSGRARLAEKFEQHAHTEPSLKEAWKKAQQQTGTTTTTTTTADK